MHNPSDFAALVAPEVDRVFRAGMRADRERGGAELVSGHGGADRVGVLIEFRTALAWPGREVSWAGLAAVTRYASFSARDHVIARAPLGAYEVSATGFRATESGQTFLTELYGHQAQTLSLFWSGVTLSSGNTISSGNAGPSGVTVSSGDTIPSGHAVERGVSLVGAVLDAAGATGGDAFAAMAPPFEPADEPEPLKLLNRLGTLRYHRADAHAAAWAAAGHTAESIAALPPGTERTAIEAQTNATAALPFAALTPDQRGELLALLAALPG